MLNTMSKSKSFTIVENTAIFAVLENGELVSELKVSNVLTAINVRLLRSRIRLSIPPSQLYGKIERKLENVSKTQKKS